MKVLKNNQFVILIVAIMLVAAGYLNFTQKEKMDNDLVPTATLMDAELYAEIGDAAFVTSNQVVSEETNEEKNSSLEVNDVQTNAKTSDYFTDSKLERDKMYSQTIEAYQKMLDSTTISEEQKAIAQNEITKINHVKNSIMIAENLILTKGFQNVIIFVNDQSVNVIVEEEELAPDKIAQIQNIVTREMKADIENIHISKK